MICATKKKDGYVFGDSIPDKKQVLSFMRSYKPTAYAEGYVADRMTGELVRGVTDDAVELDGLFWSVGDIYNLEKHDMKLRDDFLEAVRKRILD